MFQCILFFFFSSYNLFQKSALLIHVNCRFFKVVTGIRWLMYRVVWWIFISLHFLGNFTRIQRGASFIPLARTAWLSPGSVCTSGVPISVIFPDLFEWLRGTLLESHAMGSLVNADGVFSGHYLSNGKQPLFFSQSFFAGAIHSARSPKFIYRDSRHELYFTTAVLYFNAVIPGY